MDNFSRQNPPLVAPEPKMLEAYLDYHRATLLKKVDGLSDEDLRRPMTKSGLTMLGLVKHLAYVERWWFQVCYAGSDANLVFTKEDPDADWRVEPGETTAEILAFYKENVETARQLVAGADLDSRARRPGFEKYSLRWIMVHMVEEVARHNGHADIMREMIDGVTGE
jgi:uncharacterized damage-inducible protein DinB